MRLLVEQHAVPTQAEFHQAIAERGDYWYSACLRITRNPDLAADAVQDALLNAWNKRHQFERNARLETWIHRIAINAALQLLRKAGNGSHDELDENMPDPSRTVDCLRGDQELERDLSRALHSLTQMERTCFVLRHLEQWRIREIASELDTSDDTVKQAIFRAVKKLRVQLKKR